MTPFPEMKGTAEMKKLSNTLGWLACIALVLAPLAAAQAQEPEGEGWVKIFNGEDLSGWRVNEENPDSVYIEDGALVTHGPRAHVFYAGPVADHDFTDFEFRCQVKTTEGSNSGIYFHTEYQESGWPSEGYEAQVNNTHSDWRKTGSLYAVDDVRNPPAEDGQWFDYYIRVQGDRIVIKVNGETTVDYTEPENPDHLDDMPGRKLDSGTFAFQAHDPNSKAMYRNIYVRPLED